MLAENSKYSNKCTECFYVVSTNSQIELCPSPVSNNASRKSPSGIEQSQRTGPVFMSGGITYDGHISKPGSTELKVGSSENWYSRVR